MRNKFASVCQYCRRDVPVNGGDVWSYKGRWYCACDSCKATHPKQRAAAKKHQESQARRKERQEAREHPTPAQQIARMSKKQLQELLLASLSK